MLPVHFNLVLTGENFPVQSFKAEEFEFNHRTLRETLRVPIVMQAENRGVQLQVLPDRIQATVTDVRDIDSNATNLTLMLEPVFDYVGAKSIEAVGHNAQFFLDPSISKDSVADALLNQGIVNTILAREPANADIQIYVPVLNGAILKMGLLTHTEVAPVVLDFNVHFELKGTSAKTAIGHLRESLRIMSEMATRAQTALQRQEVTNR